MRNNDRHADSAGSGLSLTTSVIGALLAFALIIILALLTEELYELDEHLEAQLSIGADLESATPLTTEQVAEGVAVYVPAYGGQLPGSNGRPLAFETLISIRNTDPEASLQVDAARAFDHQGHQIASLLNGPQTVGPMQRLQLPAPTNSSQAAAADANNKIDSIVIEWSADEMINRPLIESLVIGEGGISFVSRGQTIQRR